MRGLSSGKKGGAGDETQGDDKDPRRGGDGGDPMLLRRLNNSTADSKVRLDGDDRVNGDAFDGKDFDGDAFNGNGFDGSGSDDSYRVGDEGNQSGDSVCFVGNGE